MESQGTLNKNKYHVSLTLPNAADYVSVARLALSGIANRMGFNIDQIEDLKVAISEACTNALCHGCKKDNNYSVEFIIENDRLIVEVKDNGPGFDYDQIEQPNPLQPKEGGLGIFIINSLMDDVDIISDDKKGTCIRMIKNLEE